MILKDHPIGHGGVTFANDPKLGGARVRGQSAIRYLRFGRMVDLEKLEIATTVQGRWEPAVPCAPARVLVQTLDPASHRWTTIREVNIERDPAAAGEGLSPDASEDERREFFAKAASRPAHIVDLSGMSTDHLRVVCDREHETYPNHGECNGGPFNVPYGILSGVTAHGSAKTEIATPAYLPRLSAGEIKPEAPRGIKIRQKPGVILFESRKFSVGFSLERPMLLHLGWDAFGNGGAAKNRIVDSRRYSDTVGLSGPHLRTLKVDAPSHSWTGSVSVVGSRVSYRDLDCGLGVKIDATFDIAANGMKLEFVTRCERDLPVIEFEPWRFAFMLRDFMTAAAAVPTQIEGRNGQVKLPMMWAGDGVGALSCRRVDGSRDAYIQVEAYRGAAGIGGGGSSVTGGIVLSPRVDADRCDVIGAGENRATFEWRVTAFEPESPKAADASPGLRAHWGSIFTCFRPELAGFSNQAVSTNCHVNQGHPLELVAFTRRPKYGPDPMDLLTFTIERALMGGRGYGYHRSLYLDSDPILLSGAGRIFQARSNRDFLRRVEPGMRVALERIFSTIGDEGLSLCRALTGNSGSFRWSSNAMDVVGFGHMDAYVNAHTYRGLRNAAAMFRELGDTSLAKRCRETADALRVAYQKYLLNPETGWIAGWRSRDGQLHDYAFIFVNGPALAFGLLDREASVRALENLESLRDRVGASSAVYGLPCSLLPIRYEDHMLPRIRGVLLSTFESYTDGAMMPTAAPHYLRALSTYGLKDRAKKLADDLEAGFLAGHFTGGTDSGCEFRCWDGLASGYEGTFVLSFAPLYAMAIEQGLIQPPDPEWWPADG